MAEILRGLFLHQPLVMIAGAVASYLVLAAAIAAAWWLYFQVGHGASQLDDPRSAVLFLILVATMVAGSRFGYTLLWAVLVGTIFKLALAEAVGRWHLTSGRTILSGWR